MVIERGACFVAQLSASGQYDAFGNLTAILDAAGTVISTDRSTAVTRYQYTGRDWDADSGLQYNRARWYDPQTGRWVSEDPIQFAGGDVNLSRYVGNSATYATDPSGFYKETTSWRGTKNGQQGTFYQTVHYDRMFFFGPKTNMRVGGIRFIPDSDIVRGSQTNSLGTEELRKNFEPITNGACATVDAIETAGAGTILVASVLLPGPDDVIWAAIASKYGYRLVVQGGQRFLVDKLGKRLGGKATLEVMERAAREIPGASKEVLEAATQFRLGKLLPKRKIRRSGDKVVDYLDDLGRTYDQIGNPAMVPYWHHQKCNFFRQIDKHLRKTDFTVVDVTGFPDHIKDEIYEYILGISDQLHKLILIGF